MTSTGFQDDPRTHSLPGVAEPAHGGSSAIDWFWFWRELFIGWATAPRRSLIKVVMLAASLGIVQAAQAGLYDAPQDTAPAFGEAQFGNAEHTYRGAALDEPKAFNAAPEEFGDRGPVLVKNRDGSSHGCVASRYDGLTYSHCDPFAVNDEDLPPGAAPNREPGVIPSIRRQ